MYQKPIIRSAVEDQPSRRIMRPHQSKKCKVADDVGQNGWKRRVSEICRRAKRDAHLLTDDAQEEDKIPAKDYATELGWSTDFDLDSPDEPPTTMRVLAYQDDLGRIAKKITTTARTSIEESGANMLYLCSGFLEWKDSETVQASHAPLLIMPVTIDREKASRNQGWVYQIQYSSEDLTTNLSLVEKMKRDFGVAVPYLREEDNPSSYADAVREAISSRP